MAKPKRIEKLYEWLENNKIKFVPLEDDLVSIPNFGKMIFVDTERSTYNSIFKRDREGEIGFNCPQSEEGLLMEGIGYAAFKFGDNFYYHILGEPFKLNPLKYIGEKVLEPLDDHNYINLGVHTPYELLNGSFMPDMWVKKAVWMGHKALGICDRNTMAGCFMLQKACEAAGIKPIFGYSMTVECGDYNFDAKVYTQSQKGYRNLLRIQKAIMVDNVESQTLPITELCNRSEGLVLVIGKLYPEAYQWMVTNGLFGKFDNVFYQLDLSEYKAERIDIQVLEATKRYFDKYYKVYPTYIRPILISDCYYLDKDDAKNKIILNKIAEGAAHEQSDDQYFKSLREQQITISQLFEDELLAMQIILEACKNVEWVVDHATARMDTSRNYMPKYDMTPAEKEKYGTVHNMFNQLLEEGLQKLAPKDQIDRYRKQMEYEKYIIESTDNVDYLLVQYDTCNWARSNDILVGCGRGSAAGSLLLYLLGITLVDPLKYDLIFERFLLPERAGLSPSKVTIVGQDVSSSEYIEVTLENGKTIKIDKDAQLLVNREGLTNPIVIYADEMQEDDDIIFDNRDLLFTLNEI